MVSWYVKWYYKHLSPGVWYATDCFICFLWLLRALSIACYICLFGHLPRAFCISQIHFPYCLAENQGGTLPDLGGGTNIWTQRIKSKIPIGIELIDKVFPALDCITSPFLFNINPSPFPFLLKSMVSCIIDVAVGVYAVACLVCEWTDWSCVKSPKQRHSRKRFCSQMWCRCIARVITYKILISLCLPTCEMGTILLNKNSLKVNDNLAVYQ